MANLSGEDKVALLLGAMPGETAEAVLARLPPVRADLVRQRIEALKSSPPEVLRRAARELLDLAGPAEPKPSPADAPAPPAAPSRLLAGAEAAAPPAPAVEPPPPAAARKPELPVAAEALQLFSPEALAAALKGEQVSTVALVAAHLDVPRAGAMLRLLPPEVRHEATLRLKRPGALRPDLAGRVLQAVLARCRALAARPAEATADQVLARFTEVVRALGRDDRREVLQRLEQADPEAAEKVRKKLYTFVDILRVDDRTLQSLMSTFDVRTVALALTGAAEELKAKLLANVSRRARETIQEEAELLTSVQPAQVEEAHGHFVKALQKLDEEGKITL